MLNMQCRIIIDRQPLEAREYYFFFFPGCSIPPKIASKVLLASTVCAGFCPLGVPGLEPAGLWYPDGERAPSGV